MKMRNRLVGISAWACGMLFVCTAHATPIFVDNFSFETLLGGSLPSGCGTDCSFGFDTIPGWDSTGSSGQFRPGPPATTTYFDSVPDGTTIAFTNGGSISQTVLATVDVGFIYTLLVEQGVRNDFPDPGLVELLIGGVPIFATGVPAAPASGGWSTYTATYVGTVADFGKSIGISLVSASAQGDWDNVRLDAVGPSATPEPLSLALLGIGLAALGMTRRRNQA